MSLINDALKKAQHMRSQDPGSDATSDPGLRAQSPRRKPTLSIQTLIIIVTGAAVLVSGSIFGTIYILRKPVSSITIKSEDRVISTAQPEESAAKQPEPQKAAAALTPVLVAKPSAPAEGALPNLVLPEILRRPEAKSVGTPTPEARAKAPAQVLNLTIPGSDLSTVNQAPKPATPKHNPQIQAFVDSVKVMGIRSSGDGSKVLMNDRVYRINDIVDRSLGLRLIKASPEQLVFADENGYQYIRNF